MLADQLAHFALPADLNIVPVHQGLMHSTWFVGDAYVLQKLHPKLATAAIIDDYAAVTAHLAQKGIAAPRLIPTRTGDGVLIDAAGWWRLTTRVPWTTRQKVRGAADCEAGARALGRFHVAMSDFERPFGSTHPLHDTAGHLARLDAAQAADQYVDAEPLIAEAACEIRREIEPLMLPSDLPRRVVHGDPKISNVMFEGDVAVGLIDLDTCNRHSVLVDLGDAMRSWCRDGYEDELQRFHVDRFEAILVGYAAEGLELTAPERARLVDCGRLITLELASRFARDVLEDEYFAWDAKRYASRRAHNLARMQSMLHLARDMAHKRAQAEAAATRAFGS
jgi:Ser/Thr protein kinase RdoA (MazF antagonist)